MKRCSKCGIDKPLRDFYRDRATRDGYRPDCKTCNAAARKVWYGRNREAEIERVKRWQRDNAERYNTRLREWRAANPDKIREGHLKRKFGLTLDDYAALLEAQGGGCAICGAPEPDEGSLHVDHDHETGAVRGLLCVRCNNALGLFQEDPDLLEMAAEYVLSPGPVRARVDEFTRRLFLVDGGQE